MPKLHDIWPNDCYCGAAVLAALTGCHAKKGPRAWINDVRGRPANQGVLRIDNHELLATLASRGYVAKATHLVEPKKPWLYSERPTLTQFIEDHVASGQFWIVNVTEHYVAVLNGCIADNEIRFGCPISEHPSRRKRVKAAWHIVNA
ncbi:hypothetical protein LCGC14_1185430 [marine sediment metagenome]|uniref:Uncharacterized protein n=1 Tax=marine sediment metagenome TaxID=412755 RepID=A0A0F9M8Q6_9ZZZZ